MKTRDVIRAIAGQQAVIAVPKIFVLACHGNVTAALVLSQLVYWLDRVEGNEFWKTDADLAEELGVSAHQVRRARQQLMKWGYLTCVVRGLPARTHHTVDLEVLTAAIEDIIVTKNPEKHDNDQFSESVKLVSRNRQTSFAESSNQFRDSVKPVSRNRKSPDDIYPVQDNENDVPLRLLHKITHKTTTTTTTTDPVLSQLGRDDAHNNSRSGGDFDEENTKPCTNSSHVLRDVHGRVFAAAARLMNTHRMPKPARELAFKNLLDDTRTYGETAVINALELATLNTSVHAWYPYVRGILKKTSTPTTPPKPPAPTHIDF